MSTVLAGIQLLPNLKEDHTGGMIQHSLKLVEESGLKYEVGPLETVIEGDFDSVMTLIKSIQEDAIESGASELLSNIKLHYRKDGVSFADKK
ncbi:MTH1187 family thiamine-binding protein [Shouchella sp. JSM 1781072]|uniref:thiamine-binding protein n=1 Tax=Shouchella sp. JSM 1781072 TaxID=3344581 RepID=UPI0035C11F62